MPIPLTESHLPQLHALVAQGFELVSLPRFEFFVGVRKTSFAALLEPLEGGRLRLFAGPGYLIEGNISALIERGGERWFVWKSQEVRATDELLAVLRRFEEELHHLIGDFPSV